MFVDSKSLIVNTSADNLFNFLSKEENFPKWAFHYCKSIRKDGDDYKITATCGELFFKIEADPKTGVVDMSSGPQKDQMTTFPARVSALPDGTSIFTLTCIIAEDMSDEDINGLQQAFKEEFDALQKAVA